MHKPSHAKCYADGGLVTRAKQMLNWGVGNNPDAMKQRGRDPDAVGNDAPQAPQPTTTSPGYNSGVKTKDSPAGIRFAKGGKVPGPKAETTDTVPAMLTPGEFVVRKNAVKHVGVKALQAINALGDKGPSSKGKQAARTALGPRRKMNAGGFVEEPYRPNFTMPGNKGPVLEQPRLPNNVPPSTAVATVPQKPNFTMGAQPIQQPPASNPTVTDVRPKWNPAAASPEAKAFMESRAAPPAAAPAAAPAPTAAAASPPPQTSAARAALGRLGTGARAALASPGLAGGAAGAGIVGSINALDTPTEDYEKRIGLDAYQGNSPYVKAMRDMAVRGVGVMSDVGNALLLGLPGLAFADKQGGATTVTPPAPAQVPATPAAAPTAAPAAVPAPSAAAPVVAPTNVTRVGNSYTGPANIAGDITVNGAAPRGGVSVVPSGGTGGGLGQSGADQMLQAARMAAIQRGDVESVKASFGGEFGPKVDPVQALINNGRPMTAKKAAAIAQLQSAGQSVESKAKTQGEADRLKLENDATRQLLAAQTKLTNAKTAAEKLAATDNLRALQGKYEKELPNRFTVVPGGQEIGPDGVTPITRPSRVLDNQTGRFIDQDAPAKLPPGMVRQVGTSGGKPVYVDKNGKKFIGE